MAGHDFDALYRTLKAGEFAPAYYLHGPEHQLKDEAVAAIVGAALDPSLRDFNLDNRSAPRLAPEEVETLITTLPMMAERRVVILRDVEGWNKRSKGRITLLAQLERPSPETVLILIQGDEDKPDAELVRRCQQVACDPLPPARALKWAARKAKDLEVTLEDAALAHLVRTTECSLGVIASELAKVSGLGGGEVVTMAQVEALLGVRHGETPHDWLSAVLADNTARAASLLGHVLAQPGVSGVRLVSMVGQHLLGVGIARAAFDAGRQGRALEREVFAAIRRVRPWGIDWQETARFWSVAAATWPSPRVQAGLAAALRADEALKTTTLSSEHGILLDLIMSLGFSQAAAA